MAVSIIYFVHGTTTDNEKNISTGRAPGELSELGIQQAKELGDQVDLSRYDVLFCSDLKRAVDSAILWFEGKIDIIQDERLRESHYGDLTQASEKEVSYMDHIEKRFPNGESMKDVEARIVDFLEFLKQAYDGKQIALLAHKAPQLALEVIIHGKSREQAINEDWRKTKSWQPGWEYKVE